MKEKKGDSGGRVLLVDDDPDVRRDYARMLRSFGCATETASDGKAAVNLVGEQAFDLIVSDISMPEMGGLDFLRAVRQRDLDVPVILITGTPAVETAMQAVEYGAFRYLVKPVDLDTFQQVVVRALQMHQLARLKREALEVVHGQGKTIGDRAGLEARFDRALERLWIAFQPIVYRAERKVFSYEALVRTDEESLRNPAEFFDAAIRLDRVAELSRAIRTAVARAAAEAPKDVAFFVNIEATDLSDPDLYSEASPLSPWAPRVVLEITERSSLHDVKGLQARVADLRRLGYRIALDDVGAGYAGLVSFTLLEPDFIKLDMALVQGIHLSEKKQRIVQTMIRLCGTDLGMRVIAEGVETPEEREVLSSYGCELLQGFLFAKPSRGFVTPAW